MDRGSTEQRYGVLHIKSESQTTLSKDDLCAVNAIKNTRMADSSTIDSGTITISMIQKVKLHFGMACEMELRHNQIQTFVCNKHVYLAAFYVAFFVLRRGIFWNSDTDVKNCKLKFVRSSKYLVPFM